jgi:hypothetical protein
MAAEPFRPETPTRAASAHVDPSQARITTPAPFDLFRSYRSRPKTPLNWLKAARAAAVWRARPGLARVGIYLRMGGWLARFPLDALSNLGRHGPIWKARFGRSYGQQALDIAAAAAANGLMPRDYYQCDIAKLERRGGFFGVVPYQLYATPLLTVSASRSPDKVRLANNKWELFKALSPEIPFPEMLARVCDGKILDVDGTAANLPERDFLAKPAAGMQGADIAVWRFDRAAKVWSSGGERLDRDGLQRRLIEHAARAPGGLLLQEVLVNHEEMTPFAPYALSTFRTVTIINETGEPEVVLCQFRTATNPTSVVDNFHAGGCMFFIDHETGRYREGYRRDYPNDPAPILAHPGTGKQICGEPVPSLDAVFALARGAHLKLPEPICIGWDIAWSSRGHVLLEANVPPGLQPTQQIAMGGFASSRFMQLLAFHAERWIDQTEPPNSRFQVGAGLKG